MSTLYIVATPIGNLEDISLRALRILGEVDFILCEDTRVTKKLLSHYNINTQTISYHQHSREDKIRQIIDLLHSGKNLALVTDAGTPGISDPGGKLVQAVIEKLGDSVKIEAIPGPSAVTAALSISGLPTDKFVFMGFPPHKKGRQKLLEKALSSDYPVVLYESKHRIIKLLEELKKVSSILEEESKKEETKTVFAYRKKKKTKSFKKIDLLPVVVCRELSKKYETVYRGRIDNIIKKIKENKDEQKGEFVVIVGK